MTVRHLEIFIAVYRTQNITKAAELLHMTQPSVTRAIQEIERYYGISLFERINRRLHTTEVAKQLYTQALHIVDSFDLMEKGLRNWDEFGILRIGATITLGNTFLPKAVAVFRNLHPELQIHVRVANGAYLQQSLLDNTLDLAFIEGELSDEHLCTEFLLKDRLVLIMRPDDPLGKSAAINIHDLKSANFILREEGSVGRSLLNHIFAVHRIRIEPVWESVSTHAIINAVAAGLGISFLPETLVKNAIESGIVITREINNISFVRENYIVHHKSKFLTKSLKEFMELCHQMA